MRRREEEKVQVSSHSSPHEPLLSRQGVACFRPATMPIFQIRTPLSPPPVTEEELEREMTATLKTSKPWTSAIPKSTKSTHVHEAVATFETDGSCSPSRSFLPVQPATPRGSFLLSPFMTEELQDDVTFSYTNEQLFDIAAASFFPVANESTRAGDKALDDFSLSGLHMPSLSPFPSSQGKCNSLSATVIEKVSQTDPVTAEFMRDDDHFVDTDLQRASLMEMEIDHGDRLLHVSSHVPHPLLKPGGTPDGDKKPPACETSVAPLSAISHDETRTTQISDSSLVHDRTADTGASSQNRIQALTSFGSKSPRTDREDSSEASDDLVLEQQLEPASTERDEDCGHPKPAKLALRMAPAVSRVTSSSSFADGKDGKKRLFEESVSRASGDQKRTRTDDPTPVATNTVDSEAADRSGTHQESTGDSSDSKDAIDAHAQGTSKSETSMDTKAKNVVQGPFHSFCVVEIPKSIQKGTWFQITWPEEVNGKFPVYTVQCPESFAGDESNATEGMKRVAVVAPHAQDSPPPLPPQYFGVEASGASPAEQQLSEKSPRLMSPRKNWKGQKLKRARDGEQHCVSKLPCVGSEAAELEELDEGDNSYGVLWDPIRAQQAVQNGEDHEGFIDRAGKIGLQAEECFQLLHRCNYSVREAESFLASGDPSVVSEFAVMKLSREEAARFSELIIGYKKDFYRMAVDMEGVNVPSLLAHYYASFKSDPKYGLLKRERQEPSDFCCACNDGGDLILCEGCKRWYHLSCLDPPLREVPYGAFQCFRCDRLEKNAKP